MSPTPELDTAPSSPDASSRRTAIPTEFPGTMTVTGASGDSCLARAISPRNAALGGAAVRRGDDPQRHAEDRTTSAETGLAGRDSRRYLVRVRAKKSVTCFIDSGGSSSWAPAHTTHPLRTGNRLEHLDRTGEREVLVTRHVDHEDLPVAQAAAHRRAHVALRGRVIGFRAGRLDHVRRARTPRRAPRGDRRRSTEPEQRTHREARVTDRAREQRLPRHVPRRRPPTTPRLSRRRPRDHPCAGERHARTRRRSNPRAGARRDPGLSINATPAGTPIAIAFARICAIGSSFDWWAPWPSNTSGSGRGGPGHEQQRGHPMHRRRPTSSADRVRSPCSRLALLRRLPTPLHSPRTVSSVRLRD